MKLALLSDIHGNLTAFEAALADLDQVGGADHLWILGDLALMGARPAECVRRVQALIEASKPAEPSADAAAPGEVLPPKMRVRALSGNTDRYLARGSGVVLREVPADEEAFAKARADYKATSAIIGWTLDQFTFADYQFLAGLPGELDLAVPDYGYVIGYHAVPGDDEPHLTPETPDSEAADFFLDREGRLGIGGHIHRQYDRHLSLGGWRIVNDGSVGMSYEKPGYAQWALITFDAGDAHVDLRAVPYDVEAEMEALRAAGHPNPARVERTYREGR